MTPRHDESTVALRRAVLLHGLGRTARSMRPVERALTARGYEVLNIDYPSRVADIETLATGVAREIHRWHSDGPLDFVTHSLGGILLRVAVARGYLSAARVHRAVMLGPPNDGSELADVLPTVPVFGWVFRQFTGPAGRQLGTGPGSVPGHLPPVPFDLGVIAGNRSYNPVFSAILGDANDGKVRVERARVEGMSDFLVVPYWHPLLMAAPKVIAQIIHFLETSSFQR
ncbi:MAG TPA: thioesterase domain-containing protein [Gemmatimonadaceae bacterium]